MTELFYIPDSFEEDVKKENFHSEFTFGPLERGFGYTIGNALRRTLISSITGYAIVGVVIDGVEHKFDTIEGIRETVVDIVYNLKQVRFKVDEDVLELPYEMKPKQVLEHSPTLNTVPMVESVLRKSQEAIKLAELKRRLPKKVMHATLLKILDYLQMSGKILMGTKGIVWVYTPREELNKLIKEGIEV